MAHKKPLSLASYLANIERARAKIAQPPEILRLDGETVYRFGGNVALRISHRDRRFTLWDYGIHCTVGENWGIPGDPTPGRDVSNGRMLCWSRSLAWDEGDDPMLDADDEDEWLGMDEPDDDPDSEQDPHSERELMLYCETRGRLRNAQVRAIRRVLLEELPGEIGQWAVRMRFRWLTFADVRLLWKHLEEATVIAAGNVKLLPIWLWTGVDALAPQDWDEYWKPGTLDPCAARWLRVRLTRGLPPRVWRFVCRYGARLWPSDYLLDEGDLFLHPDKRGDMIQAYLLLLTADDGYLPMSRDEKILIWNLAESCAVKIRAIPGLARVVIRECRRHREFDVDSEKQGAIARAFEMRAAIEWIYHVEAWKKGATNSADWAWWLREYPRMWASVDESANTGSLPSSWPALVDAYRVERFDVVPLSSERALRQEGQRMRHCAAEYGDECAQGYLRMFSIRDAVTEKSIATVAVRFDARDGVFIEQANGYANGPIPEDIAPVLEDLLRWCDEACAVVGKGVGFPLTEPHGNDTSRPCTRASCLFNQRCPDVVLGPEMAKPANLARLRRLRLFCLLR